METIHERPGDYDLEHVGDEEDVRFFVALLESFKPARTLELASGTGRVTIPLALAATKLSATVVGLEKQAAMLAEAERKRSELPPDARSRVHFIEGDMTTWRSDDAFELIVSPCSSLCHVQTIEAQLAAWRCAYDNLTPGGRFVVDVAMATLPVYAESMQTPPRSTLELDSDTTDPDTGVRLMRYRCQRYLPHEQRSEVQFIYDKCGPDKVVLERYVSDYESHVYYPRELELLFMLAGFDVEARFGDYRKRPLKATSQRMVFVGRRPPTPAERRHAGDHS
ncbi:MAG: class I SAM-dependent methyltransferase [Vicinamibacterales bacterium]